MQPSVVATRGANASKAQLRMPGPGADRTDAQLRREVMIVTAREGNAGHIEMVDVERYVHCP